MNLDPTIGSEIKKTRPAIIIQNDIGNKYSGVTIIAPISSNNVEKIYPVEVIILSNSSGIKKKSKIVCNQIMAVDKRRLVKKLGLANKKTIALLDEALKISLGLVEF